MVETLNTVRQLLRDFKDTPTPTLSYYIGTFVGCAVAILLSVIAIIFQALSLWQHNTFHSKEVSLENEVTKLVESADRIRSLYDNINALESVDKKQLRAKTQIEKSLYAMINPFEEHRKYLHPMLLSDADKDMKRDQLEEVGLAPRRVTLLCVSLQHFHNRVSTESAAQKLMATQVQKFLTYIYDICVTQQGGVFHKNTGNVFTIVWGLDMGLESPLEDYTAVACEAALQLVKTTNDTNVRVSVCTGDCLVGVVGNDVIKSVVVSGPTVSLATMMVKMGPLHEVQIVVDQRSLQYLDIQKYKGRPLERVQSQGIITTVFELLIAGQQQEKDGKTTSWADAFEAYAENNKPRTVEIIESLQSRNISTASIRRLQMLMKLDPPVFITSRPTVDTVIVEEELL
jgi:class 3 adenylate cyclase